ncbi:MAG: O-antigen ligase family protein [Carnobacterium sp.]|uniref:O-antigen ligase family protein n=1 Tax=Carnobacterium sp. TaxID=48221 RepID=UPI0028EBA60E|nr:O-antigen ligase family protein [Carnobacterium maltaromaticum]
MSVKSFKNVNQYSLFLMYFIVFQPILDLLTTFSIVVLQIDATPGVIIRFAITFTSALFILFSAKDKENRKFLIYLLILAVALLAGLVVTYFTKEVRSMPEELKAIAKIVYYVVMLLAYIIAFKNLKKQHEKNKYFPKMIVYAVFIINAVMIIAKLTSTSINSYMYMKNGQSGWFFAGNELGSLLAIIFPIIVWYSLTKIDNLKQLYFWIPTVMTIYSLLLVGTKVGYGAVILTLPVAVFAIVLEFFFNNKKSNKVYIANAIIAIVLIGGVIFITPYMSVASNTDVHVNYIKENEQTKTKEEKKKINEASKKEQEKKAQIDGLIFSGRDVYLERYKGFFEEAPVSQKLFGMGYGGNYVDQPKTIEMDFYDIFYQFGIIGSLFMFLPLVYYAVKILIYLINNFKKMLDVKYIMIAVSLALGIGIAYIAGHILTAPAVSIYFVSILGYLIVDLKIE